MEIFGVWGSLYDDGLLRDSPLGLLSNVFMLPEASCVEAATTDFFNNGDGDKPSLAPPERRVDILF